MKKAVKLLLPSLAAICLCISLIGGATFALFTSESKIDISVSSGKVEIAAAITDVTTYSYMLQSDGTYAQTEMTGEQKGTFYSGTSELSADGKSLSLVNIVPGDKAKITLEITNLSSVVVKYQVAIDFGEDEALLHALKITGFGEDFATNALSGTKLSKWQTLAVGSEPIECVVEIELPYNADDDGTPESIQGKTCEMQVAVQAVQGNANTIDPIDGYTYINGLADLLKFRDMVNSGIDFAGQNVQLTTDIDLSSESNWTPIGYWRTYTEPDSYEIETEARQFKGNFDGGGNTISNLTIVDSPDTEWHSNFVGLFGAIDSGRIYNLNIENVDISTTVEGANGITSCGALCGSQMNATVDHVKVYNMKVSGKSMLSAGGISGDTYGDISDCYAELTLIRCTSMFLDHGPTGGIVGTSHANITNCYAKVNAEPAVTFGGIVGKFDALGIEAESISVSNCYVIGTITGTGTSLLAGQYASGGIIGEMKGAQGHLENCYVSATRSSASPLVSYFSSTDLTVENNFANNAWSGTTARASVYYVNVSMFSGSTLGTQYFYSNLSSHKFSENMSYEEFLAALGA